MPPGSATCLANPPVPAGNESKVTSLRSGSDDQVRSLPPSGGRDQPVDFTRPPGIRLVLVRGRIRLQHRVDDPPGLFDVVLPGEQGGVAAEGVPEEPLVL